MTLTVHKCKGCGGRHVFEGVDTRPVTLADSEGNPFFTAKLKAYAVAVCDVTDKSVLVGSA